LLAAHLHRSLAQAPKACTCESVLREGDHDVVRFAWDAGGGTLNVSWRDGAVAELTVTFDA
jgi:hypothetical protein